jgi:hypothetical protein
MKKITMLVLSLLISVVAFGQQHYPVFSYDLYGRVLTPGYGPGELAQNVATTTTVFIFAGKNYEDFEACTSAVYDSHPPSVMQGYVDCAGKNATATTVTDLSGRYSFLHINAEAKSGWQIYAVMNIVGGDRRYGATSGSFYIQQIPIPDFEVRRPSN